MKKRIVITNNREIYEKLNSLNFSYEVLLRGVKSIQIQKILKTINHKDNILDIEPVGDFFVIKKKGHINFDVYLK